MSGQAECVSAWSAEAAPHPHPPVDHQKPETLPALVLLSVTSTNVTGALIGLDGLGVTSRATQDAGVVSAERGEGWVIRAEPLLHDAHGARLEGRRRAPAPL